MTDACYICVEADYRNSVIVRKVYKKNLVMREMDITMASLDYVILGVVPKKCKF